MQDEPVMLFLDNQQLLEIEFSDVAIGSAQMLDSGSVGFVQGKKTYRMLGTKVDAVNGNNRVYPRLIMTDAIKRWKQARKGALGEAGHPESYTDSDGKLAWRSKIENQVIKILDIHLPDEQGGVFFDFQTLDTAKGKDLQAILDAEGKIGCSMRAGGRGRPGKIGQKTITVATFIDLFAFDTLFDPAVRDTLGSITPLTDSQMNELLKEESQPYSDAVDPLIEKIKASNSVVDIKRLGIQVEQMELDAVDRSAVDSAYYRRFYQIMQLDEIHASEQSARRRIGFTDNQTNQGDDVNVYTFEQLMKMTDAELLRIRGEAGISVEVVAMCDAIVGQRKATTQEAELQVMKDEQNKRTAADAARAYLDSEDVKSKLSKLPVHVQDTVRIKVDLTSREAAEKTFTDAYDFVVSLVAEDKLKAMGYNRNAPLTDGQASVNGAVEFGQEGQGWREFTDKLREASDDFHIAFSGLKDENLLKINKPIVDRLLREFDKANAENLSRFADDFSSSTNTASVLNAVAFHRQIIEQAFQTLVALQFVQVTPFSGEFMEIPRENYQRSNSRPLNNGEQQPMAKGKLSLDFLHVAAEARKLAAEVTLEAMRRLQSGPLNYDILGRLNYHLSQDLQRELSLRLHNEMLFASDEYGAVEKKGETPNIDGGRTVITLLRGGTSGSPNTYVPVVRPRTTYYWTQSGKQAVTINSIKLYLAGNPVSLSGAVIDYENGKITLGTALGAGAVTVDYSYATNIALFDLTVPNGVETDKYYNQLVHLIGTQKAFMGAEPRFYSPNYLLMSETISNEVSQAEQFAELFKRNGTGLQPNGYVGRIKNIDAYEHNEPWGAGDTRILMGQRLATKYGVGTSMTTKGPFPTRDANSELTGGEEMYIFMDDATITPIKQQLRTIRLYRS
ncbi:MULTISPECIES: hypothetical protein [unclassified Paenibacillus]|uniref:hypothetical protein n=1 Tax=unclassified Paenibacillus TaxID=185978 RepID=UPI00363CC61F